MEPESRTGTDFLDAVKRNKTSKARKLLMQQQLGAFMLGEALTAAIGNRKHEEMVAFLVESGADANYHTADSRLPLHRAVYTNSGLNVVRLLVRGQADVCAVDPKTGRTVLHELAESHNEMSIYGSTPKQEVFAIASYLFSSAYPCLFLLDETNSTPSMLAEDDDIRSFFRRQEQACQRLIECYLLKHIPVPPLCHTVMRYL